MFKTQLNCAPYVAPSDLKEIQHLVRAFSDSCNFAAIKKEYENKTACRGVCTQYLGRLVYFTKLHYVGLV